MPSLMLEGDTLGEKRRHFNKLVADAVASKHYELTPICDTASDIDNLLKIEIACKTRNVDYVIEVMKSKDMLYAATAIKKSTWLITDPQYANIINPEYLHTQLKPYMTTKAFNKLMLHVRLNLKDESRVEAFYEYIKQTNDAEKWLQNCSIPFIDNATNSCVSLRLFKRLIKKSAHFLTTYDMYVGSCKRKRQAAYLIMLKSRTADVLDIFEDTSRRIFKVKMGKKRTEFLMKTCPQRILENIESYRYSIDMSVVARYMNRNEIQPFLRKKASDLRYYQEFKILANFIKKIREEERVEFVQKCFIDRTEMFLDKIEMSYMDTIRVYRWYEFFPFDIAFTKIINLIRKENSPSERCAMLSSLISSANNNSKHMKSLLTFVTEKHMNIPIKFKIDFINNLLSNVPTYEFDEATWNILDQIYHSLDVYTETENDVRLCLESIIVRKVLNDESVPESIEEKCTFSSFKYIPKTLTKEQKSKLFTYILNCTMAKTKFGGFATESDFQAALHKLEDVLILLKDFNKTLTDYPFVIEKIQELIKIQEENKWTTDMSRLYNVNKSWRKYMFEESLSLSLCEETCLNALKHKPQLLTRHDKQIHTLRTNDAVSLRRVLAKLRVYWPDSLAQHWTEAYMQSLDQPTGHAAVIKGLFVILTQNKVIEFAKKYVPNNFKINWGLTDHTEINIRINIAKYLHLARPLIPLDTVLWYAKDDYVKYAIQSHITIWSALSEVDSRENLQKLYDAPVCFLKFVLNQAFLKLKPSEVINVFWTTWKCTKIPAIRLIIFDRTRNELQKASDNDALQNELWQLLNMFIDDLSSKDECSEFYKQLINFDVIPLEKRPEYFMKISRYLASLPDFETYLHDLLYFGSRNMKSLDEDFVLNFLLSPVETIFFSSYRFTIDCLANFLLYGKSEENQLERFKKVEPAFENVFHNWYNLSSGKVNFKIYLDITTRHLVDDYSQTIPTPAKLFAEIESKMKNGLSMLENYELLTSWKLITAYVKILKLHEECPENDNEGHCNDSNISLLFGPIILQYLKEDVEEYGPMIHNTFAAALDKMFKMLFIRGNIITEALRHMLDDHDFIPAYLVVSKVMPKHSYEESKCAELEILQKLKSNASISVQLTIMPSLTLEGDTLGEKRRHFNKLVADAVATKHYQLTPICDTASDIDNLLKIEIACKTRNVDYVIEVMKSKDMLYAATAIKKSTWLITDQQYANIINPEYLHTQLKPYMTTKAFNKLMLHVRLNLKDESRVEAFYEHCNGLRNKEKWLQNCSVPFIENAISNYVSVWLFRRLVKKSNHFLTCTSYIDGKREERGAAYLLMLKSRTADILNIIEDKKGKLFITEMGKKRTEFLMKTCPHRILENIEMYRRTIDMSIVARYMNKKEIQTFLRTKASDMGFAYDFKILANFIKNMPEEERVEFIQKCFIDRTEMLFDKSEMSDIDTSIRAYQWYEFFPFDIAFPKINNLIRKENSPSERCAMLSSLISSAKTNSKHMKSLLTFVTEKHMNIPIKFKIDFVNNLLSNVPTHEFDEATWNILDQIYHSLDVYTETENDVRLCLESIIVRKVLNNEPVPESIEEKCTFSSFKNIPKTLNKEQKSKLFTYILNCTMAKTKFEGFATESDFRATLHKLENVLTLLKHFNKTLTDYPLVIEKIQELIKIKEENKWTTDMSRLYNVNKSWRKYMFDESLSLSLCEETCLNALKHKPLLLTRHDKQIHTLRTNDAVSLRRVLAKLRVYWPDSLAQHWTEAYMQSLDQPTGHAAVIKGLFMLLSQKQIIELAKKHVPENFKINWCLADHTEINIRINIAKYLHLARPLIPLDTVLWYAKDDYVKYAIQSHITIWSVLSEVDSRENLQKLYDAPVCFLKFVLNQAFLKLKPSEVIHVFWNIWKCTKTSAIKTIIFDRTTCELQKASDNEAIQNELWKLLNMFIDDISSKDECTEFYKQLINFDVIPYEKQPEYYTKIFRKLASFPDTQTYTDKILYFGPRHMDALDEDFVFNFLLSPVETLFYSSNSSIHNCFANFLIYGKTEENQLERFKKIEPAFDKAFQNWHNTNPCKDNFERFLKLVILEYKDRNWYGKTFPIPAKLFAEIESKMENALSVLENYELLTSWRLITDYVKITKLYEQRYERENEDFERDVSLVLSPIILKYLKNDVEEYGPMIHSIFAAALGKMFKMLFIRDNLITHTLRHMLNDEDFAPAFLVVSEVMPKHIRNETNYASEIYQKLKSNASISVQVQFNNDFREYVED